MTKTAESERNARGSAVSLFYLLNCSQEVYIMFREYIHRLFWLILGVAVSSIGIAMMLQANVGLEPWSVLQQGMSLRTGMTYGTASAIATFADDRRCRP